MLGFNLDPLTILINIPVFLISLSFHELAHGFVAYKLGDRTAKLDGRLSMNPIRHIDPIGFLLMILCGFGWAKPVMINMRNLKKPKRDMAVIALAGPVTNVILAFVCLMIYYPIIYALNGNVPYGLTLFFSQLFFLNLSLAIFNIIPVPPLDGSKVMAALLPPKYYFRWMQYERYGFIVLLILVITGVIGMILTPVILGRYGIYAGMSALANKIYFFLR